MPTQRKEFGRRGLSRETPSQRGQRPSHYSSGHATAAYAPAGGSALPFDDEDGFSLWAVLTNTLALFFSFQGRIGRLEYWSIGIARCVLLLGLLFAFISSTQPALAEMSQVSVTNALFMSGTGLVYTALFIAGLVNYWSLEVRRCHDRNVSGLLLLIMFIPIIGAFFGLYILIVNGFFAGTPGTNRFDTAQGLAPVFD
ncbi:DUF805 domain-containing protein [Roseibium marinum]|uniref:Uncharacterized membrane protein YhaH (DUF805 family) n=1 Tax=Roseibium marinum TaxID=281252 RepID=A0A2S3V4B9_9HYPH|nr:DUF805 domain-containing protein [Roseibium marinum]POF34623.1 uncharacterized membrane protein YhaH (DUF805 family) [Roseibium marinum]